MTEQHMDVIGRIGRMFSMIWESGVQFQVESYQKLKKMVLDAALLNTQPFKVRIKDNVEQFREWSRVLHYKLVL